MRWFSINQQREGEDETAAAGPKGRGGYYLELLLLVCLHIYLPLHLQVLLREEKMVNQSTTQELIQRNHSCSNRQFHGVSAKYALVSSGDWPRTHLEFLPEPLLQLLMGGGLQNAALRRRYYFFLGLSWLCCNSRRVYCTISFVLYCRLFSYGCCGLKFGNSTR